MEQKMQQIMDKYELMFIAVFDFEKRETKTYGDIDNVPLCSLTGIWLKDFQTAQDVYDCYKDGRVILPSISVEVKVKLITHIPVKNIMTIMVADKYKWTLEYCYKRRIDLGKDLDTLFDW